MKQKPKLIKSIRPDNFKNYYWLKIELIDFCKKNDLSTVGSKQELIQRIEVFLQTGSKVKPVLNKLITQRDSHQLITRDAPVVNYKNDAVTRRFFIEHIGSNFRFNAYLRRFTDKNNITRNLTYGDLVDGWLAEESLKKNPSYQSRIDKQFEYNQFIRDFFANEKGKFQSDAIRIWKIMKTLPGPKTYAYYKSTLKRKQT